MERFKTDEVLYQAWFMYSQILGYRKLMLLRWKQCDRCGADMVLNCKKIDGDLYTFRSEVDNCHKCRKELKQQDDESMLLAQVLG